ncbi:acyltransferase [Apibacter muscae]|nr:acyltransferase [Apibacter muscae]
MKKLIIDMNESKRIFGLDILRTIAIIFVLLGHSSTFLPKKVAHYSNKILYDGVGIFFVLSGFLIGGILMQLLENYKINVKLLLYFWKKRWYRTLPNYYFVLIILILSDSLYNKNFNFMYYLKYFFFCQNIFSINLTFFGDSWSLAIEEWFYLITPIIIYILIAIFNIKPKSAILLSAIFVISFFTLYRIIYTLNLDTLNYENIINVRYTIFGRSDSIMFGILGAYLLYYKTYFWNNYKNIFLFLGIFLSAFYYLFPISNNFYSLTLSFTITSLSVLFMLPFFYNIKRGRGIFYRMITFISLISYSLYLVNMQISKFIRFIVDNKADNFIEFYHINISNNYAWSILFAICFISFWVLTFLISIVLYKYIEVPFMRYRDKYIKFNLAKI